MKVIKIKFYYLKRWGKILIKIKIFMTKRYEIIYD